MAREIIFKALVPLAVIAIAGCGSDAPDDAKQHPRAEHAVRIISAEQALTMVHVPTLDPTTMVEAEIRQAIGAGPRCEFRYTSVGQPVLAVAMGSQDAQSRGVLKLKGSMVMLAPSRPPRKDSIALAAPPIQITSAPQESEWREAGAAFSHGQGEAVFEVGDELKVGYGGYLDCGPRPPFRMPER